MKMILIEAIQLLCILHFMVNSMDVLTSINKRGYRDEGVKCWNESLDLAVSAYSEARTVYFPAFHKISCPVNNKDARLF